MSELVSLKVEIDVTQLQRLKSVHRTKADQALRAVANEGVNIVKLSMTNSPPGTNQYRRGNRLHTASAPGNPPRVDMGALYGSIKAIRESSLRHVIVDGVHYGVYLEFGTETMAARPFMQPMIDELKKKIPIIFDNYLDD